VGRDDRERTDCSEIERRRLDRVLASILAGVYV